MDNLNAILVIVILVLVYMMYRDKPVKDKRSYFEGLDEPKMNEFNMDNFKKYQEQQRQIVDNLIKKSKEGLESKDDPDFKAPYGTGVSNREFDERVEDATEKDYGSYQDLIKDIGLDESVVTSHTDYVSNMNRTTTGASNLTERSDDNDVVTWMGLRRPEYHRAYAAYDARQEHSQFPESMPARKNYCL